jgi:hypothetical protein
MNTWTLAAALAGATLFGLTAAPALAQTVAPGVAPAPADAQAVPAKPKPKASTAGAAPVTVTVTNSRKADLVWLAGGRARLCKLDNCARRGESRQKDLG